MGHQHVDSVDSLTEHASDETPPAAALLRRPSMRIRSEVMAALKEAGFEDILPAHLGVFQYPGPDGQRPGILAQRTYASKQAMNHLLHQLEEGGYLVREQHPSDRRTRVVRLTQRGWSAVEVMRKCVDEIENAWAAALGEKVYGDLREALLDLESVLEPSPDSL